ncbi:RNase H family protein [Amycolatopsis sp. lyj-23]|uniref:RNase H family protein n=1 Tax=Amycolatopsis sp. lyj-23 TaxID=2789283 RepID=UPI00397D3DC3
MTGGHVVRIYADGVVNHDHSACAWAVSLAYGEHRRAESGSLIGAGPDRTQLFAVVAALKCLTRPSVVRIAVNSGYVIRGAAQEQPPDTDQALWQQLHRAAHPHRLTWTAADPADPEFAEVTTRAGELAHSLVGPSVGSEWRDFLADRASRLPTHTLTTYETVGSTLHRVGLREFGELDFCPAAGIIELLPKLGEVLLDGDSDGEPTHDLTTLQDTRTVLTELLAWFDERGHLDTEAPPVIEEVMTRFGRCVDAQRFADAAQEQIDSSEYMEFLLYNEAEPAVIDLDVEVCDCDPTSVTFLSDWREGLVTVGPVELPPAVAALAAEGMRVVVSAGVIDGEWCLVRVANGEL